MIVDICTYNGEADLMEIRLNVLKDHVDKFIVVEFDKTFSGKNKPSYWERDKKRFKDFKIEYHLYDETFYEKYRELAENSPNTVGAEHWKREFMQKESIKDSLEILKLDDKDIVFIGDVDEVWNPQLSLYAPKKPCKLGLTVYSYWLNNRSSEAFYGTLWARYGQIKDKCFNHLRSQPIYHDYVPGAGWHFTSMGGYEEVKRKLSDSYTEESYWSPQVQAHLEENLIHSKDFLGRDFSYIISEGEWPQYLKDTRDKYKHLLKESYGKEQGH